MQWQTSVAIVILRDCAPLKVAVHCWWTLGSRDGTKDGRSPLIPLPGIFPEPLIGRGKA